jgi:alanine racemase
MPENLYRTWCEVSLDAITHNLNEFKRIAPNAKIMAVVKADAYGHGVQEVSRTFADSGADALAVAFIDEAIQLRKNGIDIPILILGHTPVEYMGDIIDYNITPAVYNFSIAKAASNAAQRKGKTAKLHIKIDTGMNRLGYPASDETIDSILDLAMLPNVEIEGLFTHFACADEEDESFTKMQFERFMYIANELDKKGLKIPLKHVCNSAAAMRFPEMHLDMIRIGLSLYGLYPSKLKYGLNLQPAMQLKSTIVHIKEVDAGEIISYGGTYKTERKSRLATIPVGYADGYSRLLSGKARVIVNGKFAPVVGRICMDQCIIDTTDVNNINIEDEVVLFGTKDALTIPIEELADIEGTISYELLCVIGKRIPRCYTQNGRVVEILNYLL